MNHFINYGEKRPGKCEKTNQIVVSVKIVYSSKPTFHNTGVKRIKTTLLKENVKHSYRKHIFKSSNVGFQSKEHRVAAPRLVAFPLRQNALTPPPGPHSRMHLHIDLEITVAESQIKVRFYVSASNVTHVVFHRFRAVNYYCGMFVSAF